MGVADYTRLLEMMREAEAGARPRYVCDGERFFQIQARAYHPGIFRLCENFRWLRQPLQLLRHSPDSRAVSFPAVLRVSWRNAGNWRRAG